MWTFAPPRKGRGPSDGFRCRSIHPTGYGLLKAMKIPDEFRQLVLRFHHNIDREVSGEEELVAKLVQGLTKAQQKVVKEFLTQLLAGNPEWGRAAALVEGYELGLDVPRQPGTARLSDRNPGRD